MTPLAFSEDLDEEKGRVSEEEASIISTLPMIREKSDTKLMGLIEAKMRASLSNLGERTNSSMTLNSNQRK